MNKRKYILTGALVFISLSLAFGIALLLTVQKVVINYENEYGMVLYQKTLSTTFINRKINLEHKEIVGYVFDNYNGTTPSKITIDSSKTNRITVKYKTECFDMPIVRINTGGQEINSKDDYTRAQVSVSNCEDEYTKVDTAAGIRLRGNSTSRTEKQPYRIKFDEKTNLLGLNNNNKFKSWVLLAEYFDYSFSRNYTSFLIGKEFNIYCSDFTFVEIYINGSYCGVYLLCEQQEINKNRINIEEYTEGVSDSLDTGYLLENDYYYYESEDCYIETNINGVINNYNHWLVKSDTTSDEQLLYITNFMQDVNDAIFITKTESAIRGIVDIASAVDMTILQLINKDLDVNSSFYVYKNAGDERLSFVAPWDDDMAYGNHKDVALPEGVRLNHLLEGMMQNDWFVNLVKNRWQELTSAGLQEKIINGLGLVADSYEREFERNFKVYHVLGKKTFVHLADSVTGFQSQKEASLFLRNWINDRFTWLNTQYFV